MSGVRGYGVRLLAVGLVAGVAGCGGGGGSRAGQLTDPPSRSLGTTTATPIPPVSPAPVATSFPATAQGASEFVRFYYQVLEQAFATGDVATLQALSEPGCVTCASYAKAIREAYGKQQRLQGVRYSFRAAETAQVSASTATVTVVYDVPPSRTVASDGMVIASAPPMSFVNRIMELQREGDSWHVAQIIQS